MTRGDKLQTRLFHVSTQDIEDISIAFQQEMAAGLAGQSSRLKMLPSFLKKPDGNETGTFLALDFGGTNVRAQVLELLGGGRWRECNRRAYPLKDSQGRFDYISSETKSEELFDFLAELVLEVSHGQECSLGFTFSFPCVQNSVQHAELIGWTKEIKTAGVEGQDVGRLMKEALIRKGGPRITPVAIINDTVGTLLTAAYKNPVATIGAICGTGHNACYFDPVKGMIINMESGNFATLPFTVYDDQLDGNSDRPGTQRLEKMVSGRYLGEVVRLAAKDLFDITAQPYSLSTETVAALIGDYPSESIGLLQIENDQKARLKELAMDIVTRSAKLVTACFLGVLRHVDEQIKNKHTIAVDGSLYEKMPHYREIIDNTLIEMLGSKAQNIKVGLVKDGSGVGAAVAAALASK
ncbi:MAG: hexokinase [Firmicutes bacterium]|nr:hexokinase [Bacillota bacterium]